MKRIKPFNRIKGIFWVAMTLGSGLWASAQTSKMPFAVCDTHFTPKEMILAPGLRYDILFSAEESVVTPGVKMGKARGKFDMLVYTPMRQNPRNIPVPDPKVYPNAPTEPNEVGVLWVNHETADSSDLLGDGGGATVLRVIRRDTLWRKAGRGFAVDFSPVGGTWKNCLGALTPWGTVLTSEESEPHSNAEIFKEGKGIRDTSDYKGYPKYLNYGWVVEVNPHTRQIVGKHFSMGRFSHEGIYCMPDTKTVYMCDDYAPGLFFKFVARKAGVLSEGTLYVFAFKGDGGKGEWIALPTERDSLNKIREVALRKGAAVFLRLEDIELTPDGYFILSETGIDDADLSRAIAMGGKPAPHLKGLSSNGKKFSDKYGRLLKYDPKTESVNVFLSGGKAEKNNNHLSNPDNLAVDFKRKILYICEDLNGISDGRVPAHVKDYAVNEVYALDLTLKNPKLDDLTRLLVAPAGAEPTGPCFSPNYDTFFINMQNPNPDKTRGRFKSDVTVAIRGFAGTDKNSAQTSVGPMDK
jgi:secreted PhoX family phosphatase